MISLVLLSDHVLDLYFIAYNLTNLTPLLFKYPFRSATYKIGIVTIT